MISALVVAMVVFVAINAWPILEHNGLSWLGSGSDLGRQGANMQNTTQHPPPSAFHLRARLRRLSIPGIRLLASFPSVIYGLIGILVLVPFVGNDLVTTAQKESVQNVVELTGAGLSVTVVILTVMITPIMVALICEALVSVPNAWREGAVALGVSPLRAMLAVTLRAARPAIVAAAVLATARALGEAIMISMVSGSRFFVPKPVDGVVFLFARLCTLASAIVDFHEGVGSPPLKASLYAWALLLLFSAFVLSIAGYLIKLPLRKYQVRG